MIPIPTPAIHGPFLKIGGIYIAIREINAMGIVPNPATKEIFFMIHTKSREIKVFDVLRSMTWDFEKVNDELPPELKTFYAELDYVLRHYNGQ
jgi:hypothetical protein